MALLQHLGEASLREQISHIRRISHPRRLCPPHPHLAQNLGRLNVSRPNTPPIVYLAPILGEMAVKGLGWD